MTSLGTTDDEVRADGRDVLSYRQAQEMAISERTTQSLMTAPSRGGAPRRRARYDPASCS